MATVAGIVLLLIYFIVNNFTALNEKIHVESKEIRELVGTNSGKLDVLEERTSGIQDNVQRLGDEISELDTKLDQILGTKKKTELSE